MRAVVQRVTHASVRVGGRTVGSIEAGFLVYVGVAQDDDRAAADRLAEKVWNLRIVADEDGAMDRSLADTHRRALVVSQFTLQGDTRRGRRPSWGAAAAPDVAEPLVDRVVERLRELGCEVETGKFRAHMLVSSENDGPVTLVIDTG